MKNNETIIKYLQDHCICRECNGSPGQTNDTCCTDCLNTGYNQEPETMMILDLLEQVRVLDRELTFAKEFK